MTDAELLKEGIRSLAYIFDCPEAKLRESIIASKVINWMNDPFAMGAYAYKTIDTPKAVGILSKPVSDVIYFAGEAYYAGAEMGTVEAALASGASVAEQITGS
jgi:monoamine oxidase